MKKNQFKIAVLLSMFLVVLISCKGNKQEVAETEMIPENIVEMRYDQIKLADIQTDSIALKTLSGTLKVTGKVASTPQNLAEVCMPMGGFVKSTSLIPGSPVRKGQTLAVIENQAFIDIQQSYLEARNNLEYVEADYKRQSELFRNDVSSQKNMQLVTSEYKSLKVQVKALEQKLTLIGINPSRLDENTLSRSVALTSPIDGYVKTVRATIGKSVSESDVLFEIINVSRLFLELNLFEKDVNKVAEGQHIHFFINNETEQHEAIIYQTAKTIDSDNLYKVYAKVQGTCKNVLPGMYVNAVVDVSVSQVTAVPAEAVVSFDDKHYIFVFERDKKENGLSFTEYRMVQVTKGVTDDGYTEVTLPEGFDRQTAKVVVKGAYNLLSAKKNAGEMAC